MTSLPPNFIASRTSVDLMGLTAGMSKWLAGFGLLIILVLLAAMISLPGTASADQSSSAFSYEACDADPDCAVFAFGRGENVPHHVSGLTPEEEFLGQFPGCTVTGVFARSFGRMMVRTHTRITFDAGDVRCPDPVTLEKRP